MTLGTAELECFTIITNKGYAVAWVARRRTEKTVVDPHLFRWPKKKEGVNRKISREGNRKQIELVGESKFN